MLAAEPDDRLVALARAGDEAAFGAIVVRYRGPLLRYCLRFLPPAAAEDALQQTFINAYAALTRDDGRAPAALKPWLYRVAHNAALNVGRDPQAGLAELPEELDGMDCPAEAAVRKERFARVVGAVQALPPKQRQVIVRHALDGESHERIAADLGVSAGSIRQLAHRARQTVREAAAGFLPVPVLRWLPFLEAGSASGGGSGAAAKVAVALAVVTAGGGAAEVVKRDGGDGPREARAATVAQARPAARTPAPVAAAVSTPVAVRRPEPAGDSPRTSPAHRGRDDSSGHGSGSSGSSGSGGDSSSSGSSGSGSSGSGSSGSGSSGSGSSGSGSSGSGTSGSGSSGSGSSGSGSGSSGSGSSGSGSSGSGSSGSGSGSSGSGTSGSGQVAVAPTATPVATYDSSGPGSGSGSSGSGSGETEDHSGPG